MRKTLTCQRMAGPVAREAILIEIKRVGSQLPPRAPQSGSAWAQRWGGPIEEIRPGDVVWFPPGEKSLFADDRRTPAVLPASVMIQFSFE